MVDIAPPPAAIGVMLALSAFCAHCLSLPLTTKASNLSPNPAESRSRATHARAIHFQGTTWPVEAGMGCFLPSPAFCRA